MKQLFKGMSLVKKVLLFSFLITFIVVTITATICFFLQERQLRDHLSHHALDVATLWSTTIDVEEIERIKVMEKRNQALEDHLSVFNRDNFIYLESYIVDATFKHDQEWTLIATSSKYSSHSNRVFSAEKRDESFVTSFNDALNNGHATYSSIYRNKHGTWITAFSPITNKQGEIVAVLGIDLDARIIEEFQAKYALSLIVAALLITICVYFILQKGLKKVLEPVTELIYGVNEVRRGNFAVDLNVTDSSDLGVLCQDFNKMVKQLSILFAKLSETSEQMGSLSHSEGLHSIEDALDEMEHIMEQTKNNRAMQRAEKMNAIGQLAASVAHEIRNPMTVVKGFLQIFLAKDQMSEEERMYIRLMIEEMNRAETIINDYLSLAKPDLEQTECMNGKELSIKVMDLMNSYAMLSKNITMVTPVLDDVMVKGNRSELQQVLINILKNGIEAMKDGGKLSLSVYQNNYFGIFEISDTGIGMTQQEQERLGTAFYSLKEKGTGMGLTVCYQIIERMKGRIEVESEKGVGTTFKIYVPLWDEN